MKKLILLILFIFSINFIYAQRITDTNKLIVRDSAIFNNETLKITGATNEQYLKRISGRWVNADLHVYSDLTMTGSGAIGDTLKIDTTIIATKYDLTFKQDSNTYLHNNLLSIQGGDSTERYHMTALEYSTVQAVQGYIIIPSNFDFTSIPAGYSNAIWEIRHEHDLNSAIITIPDSVTLKFRGGKITDYDSIIGVNTKIDAVLEQILDTSGVISGTWNFPEAYPEWFGAISDGATNDTKPIQKVLQLSGNIVFSGGTYDVRFDSLLTTYYNLLPVKSNTNIIFRNNALVKLSGSEPSQYNGIFGIDKNNLPVSNVNFIDANIEGLPIDTATVNPAGINIMTDHDEVANSITDITVTGGKLSNLAMGIFIMQRTTLGGTTRQVKGVKIDNVIGEGCVSFITADGEDITITRCSANGRKDLRNTYDAVSIHSGQNIKVIGNTFYNYGGTGQVINIRNSIENKSGTSNVTVSDNYIYDCTQVAIQIITGIGEAVYGTTSITVSNNKIVNCNSGLLISCGSATTGTPFEYMNIDNNQFIDILNHVIWVANNTSVYLKFASITNNFGNTLATDVGSGIRVRAMTESVIANNNIKCQNIEEGITLDSLLRPVLTGGLELGVFPLYLDYFTYSTFSNNRIHMGNFNIEYTTVITNSQGIDFIGNTIFGDWLTDEYIYSKFEGNKFYEIGINNGRTFNPNWKQHNQNVIIETTAAPVALKWRYGDICINMQPSAGEYLGWVCTASTVYDEFGDLVSNAVWKGYGDQNLTLGTVTPTTQPVNISGGTGITLPAATQSAAGLFVSADKTKLDGIASGAEVNVNADWNAVSGDGEILNKPTTLGGYGITDAAPASRTLTINGTGYDLSENRIWAVGTVTSVGTGLGLTGGTITNTGTVALDTADASVLSRQRAANTYQLKGSYITENNDNDSTNELQTLALDSTATKYEIIISDGNSVSFPKGSTGSYLPLAGGTMTGNILMTSNKLIGGSETTSDLILQSTSDNAGTGSYIQFLTGNNGGTEAGRFFNNGNLNLGFGATDYNYKFAVNGGTGNGLYVKANYNLFTDNNGVPIIETYTGGGIWMPNLPSGTQSDVIYIAANGALSRGAVPSGGGGATTFLGLSDTPSSFSGQGSKSVRVNSGATALEFYTPGTEAWTSNAYGLTPVTAAYHVGIGGAATSGVALQVIEAGSSLGVADFYHSGNGNGIITGVNNTSASLYPLRVTNSNSFLFDVAASGDIYARKLEVATADTMLYLDGGKITKGLAPAGGSGGMTDPMTTRGDLIYRNSSNATARLPIGAATRILTSNGTDLSWEPASSGFANPMTTLGDIIYGGSGGAATRLAGSAGFLKSTGGAAPTWTAVTKADVGLSNVENTALSTWAGTSNITTLGTVSTGVWSGTTIAANKGGTGQTSYTVGDLLYASASGTLSKLNAGASGTVLKSNGAGLAPSYQADTDTYAGVTKGNLTENITGLQFSATRQVIGGAAELQLTTGYVIPTTTQDTNWTAAYNDKINSISFSGTTEKTLTLTQQDGGTLTASFNDIVGEAGSMVYPSAGIAISTGSAWATSITDNSTTWNTAYGWGNHATAGYLTTQTSHADVVVDGDFTSQGLMKRGASSGTYSIIADNSSNWDKYNQWDGGTTGLEAATGRSSLGGTTIGQSVFTSSNPSEIRFLRANADNSATWLSDSDFRTAIGVSNYWQQLTGAVAPATITDELRIGATTDMGIFMLQVTGNAKISDDLYVDGDIHVADRIYDSNDQPGLDGQIMTSTFTGTDWVDVIDIDTVKVLTEAYDATGWNGDMSVPTKDAVRDKIESMQTAYDSYYINTTKYLTSGVDSFLNIYTTIEPSGLTIKNTIYAIIDIHIDHGFGTYTHKTGNFSGDWSSFYGIRRQNWTEQYSDTLTTNVSLTPELVDNGDETATFRIKVNSPTTGTYHIVLAIKYLHK